MRTYPARWRQALWILIVLSLASWLTSCSFCPSGGYTPVKCSEFQDLPIVPLASQTSQVVSEQVGTVIVIHGSGSAKVDPGHGEIRVEQNQAIPLYANQATVFLNGWRANYPGDDHHVLVVSTLIGKINFAFDPNTKTNRLTWDAIGVLTDTDFKEGMTWTYNFTVLAWNSANLNAVVDQGGSQFCSPDGAYLDNYFVSANTDTNTALSTFFSFIQNPAFASTKTVAVLPRGFGFGWSSPCEDHHIRQVAYNLDHSEIFADHQKRYNKQNSQTPAPLPDTASHADSGFVSWNPYAILKDNDTRRDYLFAELVSAMGGADVGVVQPPYAILPADNGSSLFSGCGSVGSNGVVSQDFVIEDIPFQFAIPMLTGWDLEYLCDDHHVKEIGIWIDHWSYQSPGLGAAGGTLQYTVKSILRDSGNSGFFSNHKITILGLKSISGGKAGAGPAPAKAGGKALKKNS